MSMKRMAIIASKGALDMAYPPLILSSTAAAMDWEVRVFCTFYGLELLKRDLSGIRLSPLANPAMPTPIPMPVAVSALPGMESMATALMKKKLADKGVASLETLRGLCLEAGVKFVACQMTVDLFDYTRDDFIEEIDYAGAASFLEFAGAADVTLFV